MSGKVPLEYRVFNNWNKAIDIWITQWVSDSEYVTGIPGGFISATLDIADMDPDIFKTVIRQYHRVQIVEPGGDIVWEGRIEEPRRNRQTNTYQVGCLGNAVIATDVRIPWFAIDSQISNWIPAWQAHGEFLNPTSDEEAQTLKYAPKPGPYGTADRFVDVFLWRAAMLCDMRIGRYDLTLGGESPNSGFRTGIDVNAPSTNTWYTNIDLRNWINADLRQSNPIGGSGSFTDPEIQVIGVAFDQLVSTLEEGSYGLIMNPLVQAQRMDRYGNLLQSPSDYPNEYVTVPQIIEDVVGRFFVRGWVWNTGKVPFGGFDQPVVNVDLVHIDTTATAQFTDFSFFDGATAADIFNQCMAAQPNNYWAFWESGLREQNDDWAFWGSSFEWSSWAKSWGYQASAQNGDDLQDQPNGDSSYNSAFFISHRPLSEWDPREKNVRTVWGQTSDISNKTLDDVRLNRTLTVFKEEPVPGGTETVAALAEMNKYGKPQNTGTIIIDRPIHCFESGEGKRSGINRMVNPWEIRAGRKIVITDIEMDSRSDSIVYGDSDYPLEQGSVIYNVIETRFNTRTGKCELGLDTPAAWSTANQIIRSPKPSGQKVVKG